MVNPLYVLQDVPGKGRGLVATQKILKGTRIISEKPILTYTHEALNEPNMPQISAVICQQLAALSEHEWQRFDLMSHHEESPCKILKDHYIEIFISYSQCASPDFVGDQGLFLEGGFANHSCDNNAQQNWNEYIQAQTIHAMRDIEKGEEITLCYIIRLQIRKARRKKLRNYPSFFDCLCDLCSLPPDASQQSDKNLTKLEDLRVIMTRWFAAGLYQVSPLLVLRNFEQQIQLWNKQGRQDFSYAGALSATTDFVIGHGDLARGRIFAERTAAVRKTLFGADCKQYLESEALARDPRKPDGTAGTDEWKTGADEVPEGLGAEEFEAWLWRRERPAVLRDDVADLRDRVIFRARDDLPVGRIVYNEVLDCWFEIEEDGDGNKGRGKYEQRHWCFLGEMIDPLGEMDESEDEENDDPQDQTNMPPPSSSVIALRDIDHHCIPLYCGNAVDISLRRRRRAVALLYPKQLVGREDSQTTERFIYLPHPRMIKVRIAHTTTT